MQLLGGCNRPLIAEASALYAELDTLRSWHPVFTSTTPAGGHTMSISVGMQKRAEAPAWLCKTHAGVMRACAAKTS